MTMTDLVDKHDHPLRQLSQTRRQLKKPAMVAGDQVLIDVLAEVAAQCREEWKKQLAQIEAEARASIAEFKASLLEAVLAERDPAAAAKLRSITGGRGS